MARPSEELLLAWSSLSGEDSALGWHAIALPAAGPVELRAGRRSPDNAEAILLGFPSARLAASEKLPEGQGFTVERADPESAAQLWLALTRRSAGSAELFATMACDVVGVLDASAAAGAGDAKMLRVFIGRVGAWQEFMRKGFQVLSPEAVVSKSLFPEMITRLLEFSTSDQYKTEWMAKWDAKRTLQRFLANRCSKEFLSMYLEHDPELVNRIAEPTLFLGSGTEVRLVVRLHKFDLFPEHCRKKFVETVSEFALNGYDMYALRDEGIRSVFTDNEFDEFVQRVRSDLLPRLSDVRLEAQGQYEFAGPPDEHMQLVLESFDTLKKQFSNQVEATEIIEREMRLANEWIAETEPPEPKVSPRTLGTVEPSEEKHGTRSIFDDIDDGDE